MHHLTYRTLVLDAHDLDAMGAFWTQATGLTAERRGDEILLREDPAEGRATSRDIWLCQVPEPRTVKNRVHVDVHTRDIGRLVAAGGSVAEDRGWTVMTDPDGGELCAFVRHDARADGYRVYEVVADCADVEAQAHWWAERLGVEAHHDGDDPWWWLEVPGAPFDCLVLAPVPDPTSAKNRVHLDFHAPAGVTAKAVVDEILEAGATVVTEPHDGCPWWVLADPEGLQFCVFEHPEA